MILIGSFLIISRRKTESGPPETAAIIVSPFLMKGVSISMIFVSSFLASCLFKVAPGLI